MALTYPRPAPIWDFTTLTWRASDVRARSRSMFTRQLQQQFHSGQMWSGALSFAPQYEEDARLLIAWLLSLRKPPGTFLLYDTSCPTPFGTAADTPGTPVVDGAGQTGDTLAISGADPGATGYLLAGDPIGLGSGSSATMHRALEDVDTDTAGDASVLLWPDIRTAPSNGSAVVLTNPPGVFVPASNLSEWTVSRLLTEGVVLEFEEFA